MVVIKRGSNSLDFKAREGLKINEIVVAFYEK